MDWEAKIVKICEDIGIDAQVFNDDAMTRDIVTRRLGFLSYESFAAFPDPIDVIDGRGLPLLPDHRFFQLLLAEDCVQKIISNYNISQSVSDVDKQTSNLFNYMIDNFAPEFCAVAVYHATKALPFMNSTIGSGNIFDKYGDIIEVAYKEKE